MISAYTNEQISALRHHVKAKKWLKAGIIDQRQYEAICLEYPCDLYRVKLAMAVILFIGGTIGISGFEMTFLLGFLSNLDDFTPLISFVMAGIVLALTEWLLIRENTHYRTGLIQAAYLHALQLLLAATALILEDVNALVLLMASLISLIAALRYIDRLALLSSFVCFGVFVFMLFDSLERMLVFSVPILLAVVYLGLAYLSERIRKSDHHWVSGDLISASKIISLLLAYVSINVLAVSMAASQLMDLQGELPLWWLFIGLSVLFPTLMLYLGWKRRDRVLLDIGLLTAATSVLSIKFYLEIPHNPFTMAMVGLVLIIGAVALIRHFINGREGVTSRSEAGGDSSILKVLEAAQAFQQGDQKPKDTFGGGSFGGGGAEGNY